MGDPLFFSLWLRGYSALALPLYLKKALTAFPFSKLRPGAALRVFPLSFHETPILEEFIDGEVDIQDLVSRAQEFLHTDSAYQVEARWDLWQWDGDWALKPSRVYIETFGPDFDRDGDEQVRVDFGPEGLYLPNEKSDQLRPVQSNIRSLLHLTQDLENELPSDRRALWSDSEENFVQRLESMLD